MQAVQVQRLLMILICVDDACRLGHSNMQWKLDISSNCLVHIYFFCRKVMSSILISSNIHIMNKIYVLSFFNWFLCSGKKELVANHGFAMSKYKGSL